MSVILRDTYGDEIEVRAGVAGVELLATATTERMERETMDFLFDEATARELARALKLAAKLSEKGMSS